VCVRVCEWVCDKTNLLPRREERSLCCSDLSSNKITTISEVLPLPKLLLLLLDNNGIQSIAPTAFSRLSALHTL
jgi:hypothetical protein